MLTAFHAKYFAHELTKRCPSDSIQKLAATLADAQVDLNPHQIDAALFAFRSPLSKGALLADEVGLGKTIEAGILLSQKWAERKRKLLVIVPANLRKQWNQELTDKFFLPSAILETRTFNEQIRRGNLNPFNHPEIVICSYHFARAKDVYIQQVRWDLIIIDEAHRLRNVYKPASRIANAIKNAVAPFPKVLLTATPLQNSLLELYGLVSIVDEQIFGDMTSFKQQFGILNRTSGEASAAGVTRFSGNEAEGHWGPKRLKFKIGWDLDAFARFNGLATDEASIYYKPFREMVWEKAQEASKAEMSAKRSGGKSRLGSKPSPPVVDERVRNAWTALKARIKPICQRTLRRQVLEYVPFTNRKAIVQEFYPTPEEQQLYDLVSDYLQRPNLFALPPSQRQLMTLILRKLLASSTYAISATLGALSAKLETIAAEQAQAELIPEQIAPDYEAIDETEEEWTEDEPPPPEQRRYTPEELAQMGEEVKALKEFQSLARSIIKNSKGEVLLTALKRGFAAATEKGAQKKAIIFTESTRTQEYLRALLEQTEYAGRIVLFNGSNTDPKSKEIYRAWLRKHEGTDRVTGSPSADMRAGLVDYFREEAIVMVATEAAAEGINLQFCSLVVNYDLPWNPQRIEQRIGRCHRYGQKCDVVVVNFLNKANAADQRVYQLLDEKFKLFSGVFGASDEVLGAIESGVDFEKRIVQIYQTCRTPEQIEFNFNALQKELEQQIDETMQQTRQKLLENFDEEVHEKLKIKDRESSDYLTRFDHWLWQVTRYYLKPYAQFEDGKNAFILTRNPFPEENIHPGPYRSGRNVEDANLYRVGHPLAQRIIQHCKALAPAPAELSFTYTGSGKTITILEPLVGKAGWLCLASLTVSSFDTEDWLLFAGVADGGPDLDPGQCQRMFSLAATETPQLSLAADTAMRARLEAQFAGQQQAVLAALSQKNGRFFESEMEKLEGWAADLKESLEHELKELDREIKETKREAQLAASLETKVVHHKRVKELEARRSEKRRGLFEAQDAVDARKDALLTEVEARLKQTVTRTELFTVRWKVE